MLIFKGDKVLVSRAGLVELVRRPTVGVVCCSLDFTPPWQEAGLDRWCEVDENFNLSGDGFEWLKLREVWARFGDEAFTRVGAAWQYLNWINNYRLCAFCGGKLDFCELDKGRRCDKCGRVYYAPLSPAIIVAVTREFENGERRLLLAHNLGWPEDRLSVLAGFVEPGESLERTVERELYEEVKIKVGSIKYFRSQPWPFPKSLMLGFTAAWRSGEVRADGVEIGAAGWFSRDEINALALNKKLPDGASLARKLIQNFLDGF